MQADTTLGALRSAVTRLGTDPYFIASALALYRAEFQLTDEQLAKTLNCSSECLTSLALCRSPRIADEKVFLSDVQAVAKYANCDWTELARLLRTVHSISTLKRFAGANDNQLLKAARDKRPLGDEGEKPKPRKR